MTLSDKRFRVEIPGVGWNWVQSEYDVKEFIKELKKDIDESADKTDIWDNERWPKFRRILIKAIKERAGDDLI